MNRRHYAITLQQASAESPTLAMLTALTKDSSERLKAIEPLLPAGLRDTVKVMVGGAPVDAEFAKRIGADGYGSNGPAGSELAQKFRERAIPERFAG